MMSCSSPQCHYICRNDISDRCHIHIIIICTTCSLNFFANFIATTTSSRTLRFLLCPIKCFIKHTGLSNIVMDRHRRYHNTHLVFVREINMHISQ
ncbi:hypothetical protein Hanom_Chr07g00654391 [Helianthus anomalus]